MQRRHTDSGPGLSRHHISRLAFLLAGLLIAVTAASLLFVGYVASMASDEQAIRNERRLFNSVLQDRTRLIIHEQMTVARNDESVRNIVLNFDFNYVREQLGNLWSNHGHDRSLIISADNKILAESFSNYTHITRRSLEDTPSLLPLIAEARKRFEKNKVRVPGGYSYRSLQGLSESEYAAVDYVELDGKPAIMAALPIFPDKETVSLPEEGPTLILSGHFIDETFVKNLNSQLSFREMTFSQVTVASPTDAAHVVDSIEGTSLGSFRWVSENRADTIWPTVIPVILLLSIALAFLAFGIAWRIGRLTTSLQASERQNRYLALHDTLSGLANRLQFNRALANAVKSLPDKRFAIVHCDLDRFKAVNDSHGHAAGDAVIKEVARRMKVAVGENDLVARVGGDEFMIIMRSTTDRTRLRKLSNELIAAISSPISLPGGEDATIGLSIGISIAPDQGVDGEELVAASDAALYFSKEQGRGRMVFARDLPALQSAAAIEAAERGVDPLQAAS